MENVTPTPQDNDSIIITKVSKPLTAKERMYCYKIIEGLSPREAARAVGYNENTATNASRWIREDREASGKPHLWDLLQVLLKKKLRLFDINVDNVLRELTIIGFSSLHQFIDFKSKADLQAEALEARGLNMGQATDDVNEWKKYRAGSTIRLKPSEEIPIELIPAIAEINETKDGIRIKLHNKLDAIDKMMRYLAMYKNDSNKLEGDDLSDIIKEINIFVDADDRSPLMKLLPGGNQPAKSA